MRLRVIHPNTRTLEPKACCTIRDLGLPGARLCAAVCRFRPLHKAVVSVLARALECCLDPPLDFRNPQRSFGGVPAIVNDDNRESSIDEKTGTAAEARF